VAGDHRPPGRDDVQVVLAEPVPDGDPHPRHPGRDRVEVALEGDQRLRADRPFRLQLGRKGQGGRREQGLGRGELRDSHLHSVDAAAALVHPDGELVDAGLGLLDADAVRDRAPPALRGSVVGLFDHAFAVAATGRADRDLNAVELRDPGERGGDLAAGGVADGRHPVEPPPPDGPPEPAQHLVEGLDQVREVLRLRQHRPPPARMRKRPHQQMGVAIDTPARRRLGQLDPVELDLLARRVLDHRPVPALRCVAGLAVRPDLVAAKRTREGRIGAPAAELDQLVEESGGPQVRVVGEPLAAVVQERYERIRGLAALPRRTLAVQVGADRLAVASQMAGDRRDRPALATQRVRVEVFLHREHPALRRGPTRCSRRLAAPNPGHPDTPDDTTRRVGNSAQQVCPTPQQHLRKFK
jgi:hypothetical protein